MDSAATTLSAAGQDESSYLAESAAPEAESSWTDEHGATWTYRKSISGDAIVLTGLSNKSEFAGADVLVPDEIDGLPVTRISGEGALADTNAKSVTFPATLTNIDDQSGTFFNNMVQSSPQGKIFFLGGCPTVPSGDWSKVTTVTIGREGVIYAVGGQDAWVSAGAPFGAYVGNYIAPESVSLENTSVSIPAGGRATLSASVLPARDSYYSAHNSIFWYSDSSILDVDGSTGLVKVSSSATVGDTATVIAQNGTGLEATCTVTVAEAPTAIDISDCTVSPSTYPDVYYNNGSPKLPQITVTSPSGETLEEGLDYTLTYTDSSNNAVDSPTEIGSYTATITGILPYYTGTKTMSFSITAERQPILGWSYTVDSNGEATITGYTGEEATTLVVPGSIDGAKVTTVSSLGSASATTIVIPDCVTTIGDLSGATASTVRFLGDLPTGASASTLPSGASVERFDAYSSSYADFTGATAPTVLWKYYYDLELDGSSTGVLGSAVEATSSTPVPTGCQMASDAELDFTLPTQIDGVDLSVIGERALGSDSKIDFNIVRVPACYKTVDSECFLNLDAIVHFYSTPPAKIGDSAIGVTSGTLDPWLEIFYPEDYESEWEEWATANSVDLRGGFDMNYTATIGYKDGHVGETAYRKAYITAYNGLLGATFDSSDVGTFYYQIFYGFKNSNIDGTNLTSLILENTTYSDGSVSGACEFYGTAFKNLTCDITFLGAPPTSDNYAEAFKGVDGAAYTGTIYVEQEYLSQWQSSEWANYYTIEMKSDSDPTHFTYTDNGDGTYTVTGYTGDSDSITVPGNLDNVVIDGVTYNGIVTKVGNSAFESDSSKNTYYKLRTVVLPDTIINIGNSAFENTNLTYIDLGNGVETMGNRVFWGCRYLTSIELPASLKSLGFTPWCASSITDFTVEEGSQYYDDIDGVLYSANHDVLVAYPLARTDSTYTVDPSTKVIGEAAFRGAYGYYGDLKEIVLPDGLMEIQDYAFQQMDGLETINIPDSVTKIGVYTFQSASDLKSINFPKACTKVPDGFIQFCDSITSVELHEDVTEIGEEAFSFCSNLTSVSLNEGLVKIGDYAFLDASKLPEVEIPSTVETIGSGAFEGCSSIKELDITGANVTTIGSAAFSGMSSLKSFVIPSTVTSIGSYMFSSDYKLKSVTFEEPVQITTIPEACFNACYGLETVTIPRTVTNIAKWAFYNDTEISVVMLNKGDFTVDSTAFDFDFKELGLYTSNAKIYGYSTSTSPTAANECDVTFRPIDVTVTASWDSENEIWTNQKLELSATVNAKSGDAACQWYVNDEPIDGATSSTYTFSSTEAGTYILSLKCNNSTYDPTDPAPEVRYAVVHVYDKASIDRTGLDEAINVATEDLESTKMSEDGSDVVAEDSWVSEDVYNELQDAIDEATAVNANEDSKQSQINTATDTLNAAVEKFDAAKSAGKADRTWERISGSNRYETMAMISSNEFDSCKHAVLASGENFPDALAANGLAGSYGSPVILTTSDSLSYEAKAELERLGVKSVDIMGGEAAVSKNVVEELEDMGISVTRVSGSDRVQTSIASYKKIRVTADMGEKPDTVIIASGDSFADALSVGPLAYANKYPLVLVSNGTLSDAAVEEIMGDDNIENVIIVGGEAAVSSNVENQLAGNGYNFTRLSGSNRYETSAAIAKYSLDNGLTLSQPAVATGDNFPDALAASSMCGANRSVLLLVSSDGHEAIDVMNPQSSSIARGWIIGGEKAVPESVGRNIAGSLDMHLKL